MLSVRHRDEAFGEDYEPPSGRAYAEACATIADIEWSWRMLLANGVTTAPCAGSVERELYNALVAAADHSGTKFFYSNPLQLRPDRVGEENAPRERQSWYLCACCPPNVARTLVQLGAYMASSTNESLYVHQLAPMEVDIPEHLGRGVVEVRTTYPQGGSLEVSLRGELAPCKDVRVRVPDGVQHSLHSETESGYLVLGNLLQEPFTVTSTAAPRVVQANPRVDAVRGCVALM